MCSVVLKNNSIICIKTSIKWSSCKSNQFLELFPIWQLQPDIHMLKVKISKNKKMLKTTYRRHIFHQSRKVVIPNYDGDRPYKYEEL